MWDEIATERRRLADELEQLTPKQWDTQSQCDAWTVRQLAAHLIMPFEVSNPRFLVAMLKHRFDFDKVAITKSNEIADRMSNDDLVDALRNHADSRWTPPAPGMGAEIVLAEIVVHGQDIRNAVGMECSVPAPTIEAALAGIKDQTVREDYRRRIEG
jgi:uncharacterized protein (TIGR03083 family)